MTTNAATPINTHIFIFYPFFSSGFLSFSPNFFFASSSTLLKAAYPILLAKLAAPFSSYASPSFFSSAGASAGFSAGVSAGAYSAGAASSPSKTLSCITRAFFYNNN